MMTRGVKSSRAVTHTLIKHSDFPHQLIQLDQTEAKGQRLKQSLFLSLGEASHTHASRLTESIWRELTSSPCCSSRERKRIKAGEGRFKEERKRVERHPTSSFSVCDPEKEAALLMG